MPVAARKNQTPGAFKRVMPTGSLRKIHLGNHFNFPMYKKKMTAAIIMQERATPPKRMEISRERKPFTAVLSARRMGMTPPTKLMIM